MTLLSKKPGTCVINDCKNKQYNNGLLCEKHFKEFIIGTCPIEETTIPKSRKEITKP